MKSDERPFYRMVFEQAICDCFLEKEQRKLNMFRAIKSDKISGNDMLIELSYGIFDFIKRVYKNTENWDFPEFISYILGLYYIQKEESSNENACSDK